MGTLEVLVLAGWKVTSLGSSNAPGPVDFVFLQTSHYYSKLPEKAVQSPFTTWFVSSDSS